MSEFFNKSNGLRYACRNGGIALLWAHSRNGSQNGSLSGHVLCQNWTSGFEVQKFWTRKSRIKSIFRRNF